MFHVGRSGSTVLGDLLSQHPLIQWDSEIYNRLFLERAKEDERIPSPIGIDATEYALKRSQSFFSRFYGFEVQFFHLRILGAELGPYLAGLGENLRNLRVIVLERRNTLRVVVSTLAARNTGVWHIKGKQTHRSEPVHIDVNAVVMGRKTGKLIDILTEVSRDFADLQTLVQQYPYVYLTYEEDVLVDPTAAYEKICNHLDLPSYPVSVRLSRTNPGPLYEKIANFDEVSSLLHGTAFEWMLYSQ